MWSEMRRYGQQVSVSARVKCTAATTTSGTGRRTVTSLRGSKSGAALLSLTLQLEEKSEREEYQQFHPGWLVFLSSISKMQGPRSEGEWLSLITSLKEKTKREEC